MRSRVVAALAAVGTLLAACGAGQTPAASSAQPSASAARPEVPVRPPSPAPTRLVHALPTRDFGYLPVLAAVSKGYFLEEGLEIEHPVMTTTAAIPALINKELQIGPNAARVAYQGAPTRTVFYQFNKFT